MSENKENDFIIKKDKSIIEFCNKKTNKKARFDLKDNSYYTYYNNKYNKVKNLKNFFSGYRAEYVIEGFEDEKYKKFIKTIQDREYYYCSNVGTLLERLYKYSNLENFILMNIDVDEEVTIKSNEINKYILRYLIDRKFKLTKTFENNYKSNKKLILDIIKFSNENLDDYSNELIYNKLICNYTMLEIFKNLVDSYNYEYKSLIKYLFDYLPNREAFSYSNYYSVSSLIMLKDYADMQSAMSKNGKFNKYPKYLKTIHDIIVSNYNCFKREYKEELFVKRINNDYAYSNNRYEYSIIVPQSTNDIKQEGADMHNCVGSYIDKIIDGKTNIVFLRYKKKPNESLATVEIKNNELCQAFRQYNSSLTNEDKEFLKHYCEVKKIKYSL